ncbi:gamma-glutamyl-gamma-aminobutyrate hydrolase family protein [Thiococcus pfennigii]|uniref:gamma-glutamyl-gamma-aminobutyrate hydrolase family protein n=1 Tax=Thiococcus pfennigii TaxID=1057 RepID=UPI0019038BFB|nr:peptidase C26 [Thiococcus pfennigii]
MAEGTGRPLIAVTGPRRGGRAPRLFVALALRLAGARPLQVGPGRDAGRGGMRGLIVTGGHDVEPVLYAEAPQVTGRYDKERDAFESFMIDEALARGLPILGICRGAQLLNVRLGGNLFQELRSRRRRTSNQRTVLPLKTLLVAEGTQLHRLLGCERLRINSLHNQGIDRLGPGLAVSGRDLDGIVQAIEAPGEDYCIGVQWHPEFLLYSRRQRRLFGGLVAAARRHGGD